MHTNKRRALLGLARAGAMLSLAPAAARAASKDPLPRTKEQVEDDDNNQRRHCDQQRRVGQFTHSCPFRLGQKNSRPVTMPITKVTAIIGQ